MKKILVMAAAMLFSLQGIHAQTDVTEETDSDDIIDDIIAICFFCNVGLGMNAL